MALFFEKYKVYLYGLLGIGVVIALCAAGYFLYHAGVNSERVKFEKYQKDQAQQLADVTNKYINTVSQLNSVRNKAQKDLADQTYDAEKRLQEAKDHAQSEKDQLIADFRSGKYSVSVNLPAPTGTKGNNDADAGDATGTSESGTETTALSPRFAESLVNSAKAADDVIREYNTRIEQIKLYNQAVEKWRAQIKQVLEENGIEVDFVVPSQMTTETK